MSKSISINPSAVNTQTHISENGREPPRRRRRFRKDKTMRLTAPLHITSECCERILHDPRPIETINAAAGNPALERGERSAIAGFLEMYHHWCTNFCRNFAVEDQTVGRNPQGAESRIGRIVDRL
jgi:hypothetical protein